jgi:uncharacterized protein YoxC
MKPVDSFLNSVRHRMNKNRACRALLWAAVIGGAVLLTVSLIYVFKGYEVPRYWYAVAGGATVLGGIAGAVARRASITEASQFADGFFGLKDTIVSQRRFESEHKEGGYYDLQAGATAEAIRPLKAAKVPFEWPKKLGAAACVLTMACGLTAFKSTDQQILDRIKQEKLTESQMEEIKNAFEEMIKELEKTADDEEKKALNPDELKKYVKDLEATKDLAEAMRQLADLERKIDKAAQALDQKRDEQLMKKAGEELEKEEDPQARDLAKKLKNEQFKEAAKDLEKMKPEDREGKKLSEKRKEAAKLKAAAKRMAAAARAQKNNQSKNSKDGKQSDQKSMTAQMSKGADNEELTEELEKLEMEADEYDASLEDLENLEKLGKIDPSKLGKCEKCEGDLKGRLDKLGKNLGKMAAKRSAKLKLLGMCKKAGQCQGMCQGQCQSPFARPGGLKPGNGTLENSRDEKDELTDNGQTTQLKGQKGAGPSITKVEAADDGTGVSHRKAEAKERTFKMQFESFVQREDVPEDVKDGVKQYFESLHAAEPAKGAAPAEGAK